MKKKFYPSSIAQSFRLIVFSVLLSIPLTFPLLFLESRQTLSPMFVGSCCFIIVYLVIICVSSYVNIKRQISVTYINKISKPSFIPQMILLLIIFSLGVQKPINYFLNEILGNDNSLKNPIDNIVFSLGAVILAPLFEEIVFRGIVLRGFLSTYSPKKAIIYSAVIFGVIHGKPLQIWGAVVIGLFLGWIYYKTKNIGVAILLHFIVNLSSLLVSYYQVHYDSKFYNIYIIPIAISSLFFLSLNLYKKMKEYKVDHIEQYRNA